MEMIQELLTKDNVLGVWKKINAGRWRNEESRFFLLLQTELLLFLGFLRFMFLGRIP
jgi:hypothetical protein